MKQPPIILASPEAYERLSRNDPSIQHVFDKLVGLAFSRADRTDLPFRLHLQGGDGIITLLGATEEPDIFILAGRGEGFGPPDEHRLPEGHGVYPPREFLRRGHFGPLRRIAIA